MAGTRNAYCSFCRKSYQDVGPLVEGPDNVFICDECVDLTRTIIDQERLRRSPGNWADYLLRKVDRVARSVEGEVVTLDPRMLRLTNSEGRDVDPGLFQSLHDLCQATALLTGIKGILERVRAKSLKDPELAVLQEIESKVAQLQTALEVRAGEQGTA